MKEIIDELDFVKIKNFCSEKDMIRKWKAKPQLEKNFAKTLSDKHLVFKIYKELLKLNSKKTKNLFLLVWAPITNTREWVV